MGADIINGTHWNIERDEADIAWLHLDMADSKVNLLKGAVIDELDGILDKFSDNMPNAVVILSDKKNSFVFGADIQVLAPIFRNSLRWKTVNRHRRFLIVATN